MNRRIIETSILFFVGAIVVPVLLFRSPDVGTTFASQTAASPFGLQSLLVAHLITAIPLAFALQGVIIERVKATVFFMTFILFWVFTLSFTKDVARILDTTTSFFAIRSLVRSLLAVALVLPWAGLATVTLSSKSRLDRDRLLWFAVVVMATLPAMSLAYRIREGRRISARTNLDTGRLSRARADANILVDLGDGQLLSGANPKEVVRSLDTRIQRIQTGVNTIRFPNTSAAKTIEIAFMLIQLDRLDEARVILEPLSKNDPSAALLLASLNRDLMRWEDCLASYRRAIELLPRGRSDFQTREDFRLAFDGVAESLRALGKPVEANAALAEAKIALPWDAAHFTLTQARYYLDSGRPLDASRELSKALDLDPKLTKPAEPLLRKIRVQTPACLIHIR